MSNEFKLEVVEPDKIFIEKNVEHVVVPAVEGQIGFLKDHISIISFLKPGILNVFSKDEDEKYYIEDGVLEFKNGTLSILTSKILSLKDINSEFISENIKKSENGLLEENLSDEQKYLVNQKIEVLKGLSTN